MEELISKKDLLEKTTEWEAQAWDMVDKYSPDNDPKNNWEEWYKWSNILRERIGFKNAVIDAPTIIEMPDTDSRWIPVTEELPKNEQKVLITVEVRLKGFEPYRYIAMGFYEDGTWTDAQSNYSWDFSDDYEWDEDGNIKIKEGWWESVSYSDEFSSIDDFVIAWMPLPGKYEGDK